MEAADSGVKKNFLASKRHQLGYREQLGPYGVLCLGSPNTDVSGTCSSLRKGRRLNKAKAFRHQDLAHLRVESLLSYSGEERDAGHGCSQLPPRKGRSQLQHSQAVHDSSGKGRSLFGAATQSNNGIGESSCHAVICGSATDGERVINDPSAAISGLKLVSWGTLRETTVMEDSLWRWSAGTLNHNICDGKSFRILRRKEPYDRWSKVSGAVRQNNSGCIQQLYCKILDTLHIPDSGGPNCGTFLGCQGMTRNLDRDRVQPMESLQGEDLRVNISSSGMFFQVGTGPHASIPRVRSSALLNTR
ncbi:uncharacterized protein LOC134522126 [Chroicocephalus ridibundus]|uniref:uncharacterized protein LOC134522126 n=1 Tax=Chroicocephalus ridibundus TaxID=1192867 RepID=UPI002FDE24E9